MTTTTTETLSDLFESDETAWLEIMAALVRAGRIEQLDMTHLAEYLSDMARRDRREVKSRLVFLMLHLLKWEHQPEKRTRSWRGSIIEHRQELGGLITRGLLRSHAAEVLDDAYSDAVERAAAETGLGREQFPIDCPYSVDGLLSTGFSEE